MISMTASAKELHGYPLKYMIVLLTSFNCADYFEQLFWTEAGVNQVLYYY